MRTRFYMVLGMAFLVACSQRVTPEEEFARQDRERPIVSAGSARLPVVAGAPAGGMAGARPPDAEGPTSADAAAQTIRGTIEAPAAPAGGVLFLFVRAAGATGGPPLAVQRIATPSFPRDFAIGPQDAMIAGGPFPARVTLEARLDGDGNAMTESPDDLSARAEVAPGATGVTLTLVPGA